MEKKKLGDIEINLTSLGKLVEFAVILAIAYIVSNGIRDSLIVAGFVLPQAVSVQWGAFFALVLIYYGYIRVKLNISY